MWRTCLPRLTVCLQFDPPIHQITTTTSTATESFCQVLDNQSCLGTNSILSNYLFVFPRRYNIIYIPISHKLCPCIISAFPGWLMACLLQWYSGVGTSILDGREVPRWWPPFLEFSIRLGPYLIPQYNSIDPLFLQKKYVCLYHI